MLGLMVRGSRPSCLLRGGSELGLKPGFKLKDNPVLLLHLQKGFPQPLGPFPVLFIGYNAFSALKQEALLEAAKSPAAGW